MEEAACEVAASDGTAAVPAEDTSHGVFISESIPVGDSDRDGPLESAPRITKTESKTVTPASANKATVLRDVEQDWAVFSESNYSFEPDKSMGSKWGSGGAEALLQKRQEAYLREGTRRSVAAVFLVHRMEYPHILLLLDQQQQKHFLVTFKYKTWQKPREVLHDKLLKHLIKPDLNTRRKWVAQQLTSEASEMEVGEFLGEWWRCEFDDELIPYLPPHVTRPKERVRVHQVQLASRCSFRIPTGFCLTAVPVFDLAPHRVGLAISGLSHLLARFSLRLMVPTSDKYEAQNSLENKGGPEEVAANADTNAPADRSDSGGVGEMEPADEPLEDLETLPPELQHLAELEEAA